MEVDAKKMHITLLEMFKQFHDICQKKGLRYYMLGGTCLGARRHEGFIPWDDDIDVGMPREDYEIFLKTNVSAYYNNLEILTYTNTKECPIHFIKLVNNNTTLIEDNYHNFLEGIYIDVFPLDGINGGYEENKKICKEIWSIHSMIMTHCSTTPRTSNVKKMRKKFCEFIDLNWLHHSLERRMKRNTFDSSDHIANYLGAWHEREIVPKYVFGTPKIYKFEDGNFYGPEQIDAYLTALYGNFMELPPKEKRVFRHSQFVILFDVPFRKYKSYLINSAQNKN